MKSRKILSTCLTLAALACLAPVSAGIVTTTVFADFDSHRTLNFGPFDGGPGLGVGTDGSTNNDQRAFIHFNLADLATPSDPITQAIFRVRLTSDFQPFGSASLFEITAPWDAGTVPFTQPVSLPTAGNIIGPPASQAAGYYDVDVTSVLQNWQLTNAADPSLFYGFSIRGTETFTQTFKIFSSQESAFAPELMISQVPEPSTVILASLLLGCAIGYRRFQTSAR